MNTLKPLDLVVALKIGVNERSKRLVISGDIDHPISGNSVGELADSLDRGKADISRSINRLLRFGLIGERAPLKDETATNRRYYSVQRKALTELIVYGLRFVFQPDKLGFGRGVPTGWNCPFVKTPMNAPDTPLVWPNVSGEVVGELLEPLYPGVVYAAGIDKDLYSILSLIDVVRTGKPRELKYAVEVLQEKIGDLHS